MRTSTTAAVLAIALCLCAGTSHAVWQWMRGAALTDFKKSDWALLQQTAALKAAVDSVTMLLMEDHVSGCLRTAVKTGDADAYTEEVMDVVRRSMGRPARQNRASSES